ncbi:MAG: hypothetical protein RR054_04705 [Clostridia bacterium]
MIYRDIDNLLEYSEIHLMANEADKVYNRNRLLALFRIKDYEDCGIDNNIMQLSNPESLLKPLVSYAVERGIIEIEQTESIKSESMDIVSLRPSELQAWFAEMYVEDSMAAMDWFYNYCVKNNYIKATAIAKNICWLAQNTKHKLQITINLTKPEKNNKDIATAAKQRGKKYPMCVICYENEGYAGSDKQNLRTIPITLNGEEWFWQFSPYAYFYKHGVAINRKHKPMEVTIETVEKLVEFCDMFPKWFIGCNAALARIGGSLLMHDHFQGGEYEMPIHNCGYLKVFEDHKYTNTKIGIVNWYNSVIRIEGNKTQVLQLCNKIIDKWSNYTNEKLNIIAKTDEQHNSLSPIARKKGMNYIVDLILRNNRCNFEFSDGIFHAHKQWHFIKNEGIGLIEAMGLFILPARLEGQLLLVKKYLIGEDIHFDDDYSDFYKFAQKLSEKYGLCNDITQADSIIKNEVGEICENILYDTAVFKPYENDSMEALYCFVEDILR